MVDKRLNTKKASDYSEAFNSVELRGFEPLTLSMPWRCATSCAIAPNSFISCFLSRLIIYLKSV